MNFVRELHRRAEPLILESQNIRHAAMALDVAGGRWRQPFDQLPRNIEATQEPLVILPSAIVNGRP
jgi:hypothetical protein